MVPTMKMVYMVFILGASAGGLLEAAPQLEATPWTKSFLETRVAASVQRYAINREAQRRESLSHCQVDGMLMASTSPWQDWEVDLGIQGRSLPTGKLSVRVERQLCSDLEHAPCAVMAVLDGSISGRSRSRSPVYFEIAKNVVDIGIGLGRHLVNEKDIYTQAFLFVFGGIGSSNARFASGEVGLHHVINRRHAIRVSYQYLQSMGRSHEPFRGIGTLQTSFSTMAVSYAYRFASGIESRISVAYRMSPWHLLRRSTMLQASVSIPIAF